MARGKHLFPFRTEPLSPSAPMVLGPQGPGRVGRRRFFLQYSVMDRSDGMADGGSAGDPHRRRPHVSTRRPDGRSPGAPRPGEPLTRRARENAAGEPTGDGPGGPAPADVTDPGAGKTGTPGPGAGDPGSGGPGAGDP